MITRELDVKVLISLLELPPSGSDRLGRQICPTVTQIVKGETVQ